MATKQAVQPLDLADVRFTVIGQFVFGNGRDLAEAKRNFQRQGGALTRGYTALEWPDGLTYVGVDGMGRVTWTWDDGADETLQPVVTTVKPR
jgi:hypothetical protein